MELERGRLLVGHQLALSRGEQRLGLQVVLRHLNERLVLLLREEGLAGFAGLVSRCRLGNVGAGLG